MALESREQLSQKQCAAIHSTPRSGLPACAEAAVSQCLSSLRNRTVNLMPAKSSIQVCLPSLQIHLETGTTSYSPMLQKGLSLMRKNIILMKSANLGTKPQRYHLQVNKLLRASGPSSRGWGKNLFSVQAFSEH